MTDISHPISFLMTQNQVADRIREYITENFLYMRQDFAFDENDSLLGRGIIDSMGVIELITFIQDEFGIPVDDGDITEENLGTLASIAGFVAGKQAASRAA